MIEINAGDLNLQTLAGNATLFVDGSDMPNVLYVFGIGDARYDYYLDPLIFRVGELATFLQERGFNLKINMNYNPKKRPAVGIRRAVREENIEAATEFCILVLLHINNRLTF